MITWLSSSLHLRWNSSVGRAHQVSGCFCVGAARLTPSLGLRLYLCLPCSSSASACLSDPFPKPSGNQEGVVYPWCSAHSMSAFLNRIKPHALWYTLYVISCSPRLLEWGGWLCTILGRIEEAFTQSILCYVVQMKMIILMSKLGFSAPFSQLNKWRFRDVVVARASQEVIRLRFERRAAWLRRSTRFHVPVSSVACHSLRQQCSHRTSCKLDDSCLLTWRWDLSGGPWGWAWGLTGVQGQSSLCLTSGADGASWQCLREHQRAVAMPAMERAWYIFMLLGCGNLLWMQGQHLWTQLMTSLRSWCLNVLHIGLLAHLARALKDPISWLEITSAHFPVAGPLCVITEETRVHHCNFSDRVPDSKYGPL